jgi:hypothetical protein
VSYATPFYYAAKAVQTSEPAGHPHHVKPRRRRIRLMLFPAQRPHRPQAQVATASSSDC